MPGVYFILLSTVSIVIFEEETMAPRTAHTYHTHTHGGTVTARKTGLTLLLRFYTCLVAALFARGRVSVW